MIIEERHGNDIFTTEAKHIAFAINTEGFNDSGFAGLVSSKFWPELANCGHHELGTALTHFSDGIYFHALVCHSLEEGWNNQAEVIRQCFDAINTNEVIASISIGTGLIGILSGADFEEIEKGMKISSKKIVLY